MNYGLGCFWCSHFHTHSTTAFIIMMLAMPFLGVIFLAIAPIHAVIIAGKPASPILLVPGIFGSELEAKLNGNFRPSKCYKNDQYFRLWPEARFALTNDNDCFFGIMRMSNAQYGERSFNAEGVVDVHAIDWGESRAVESFVMSKKVTINETRHQVIASDSKRLEDRVPIEYFKAMIDHFVKIGYDRRTSIRAAPYDWRLGTWQSRDLYERMRRLIEEMYTDNNETPVTIICHSFGCIHTYMMLLLSNNVPWRMKYVKSFISLGAPYAGSVAASLLVTTHGKLLFAKEETDHFSWLTADKVKVAFRTFGSIVNLIPDPDIFAEQTVLTIDGISMTMREVERYICADSEFGTHGLRDYYLCVLLGRAHSDYKPGFYPAPGVETHCITSTGVDTISGLGFLSLHGEFRETPDYEYTDRGDGIVEEKSAGICKQWSSEQGYDVHVATGVHHHDLVKDEQVLRYISQVMGLPASSAIYLGNPVILICVSVVFALLSVY